MKRWSDLLAKMKGEDVASRYVSVGGGGNSYWNMCVVDSKLRLIYDISGSGGDSRFHIDLSFETMIPVIEEIIKIYQSGVIEDC